MTEQRRPIVLDWSGHELEPSEDMWVHRYVLTFESDSHATSEVIYGEDPFDAGGRRRREEIPVEAIRSPVVRYVRREGRLVYMPEDLHSGAGSRRVRGWG